MRHRNHTCRLTRLSWITCTALAGLILLPVIGCSNSSSSPPPPSGATNFVYTANAALTPSVSALVSNPTTGALSPITGSMLDAGSGSRALKADAAGKFLFVANGSSGDISVFTINSATGALTAVAGSPFLAEPGVTAIAIDPAGAYLYAASGSSGNLWEFSIDATGALHNLATSPFLVDPAALLSAVIVDPSGKYLYVAGTTSTASSLYGFTRGAATGVASPMTGPPFAIDHSGNSVTTDPSGKFVLVAATGSSTQFGLVDVFSLDATTGTLTAVTNSPFHTGVDPNAITVDPSGKFVYVANTADVTVSAFTLDGTSGALAAVAGSPFPSGGHGTTNGPLGIAVAPSGNYVYVCNASNDISVFALDTQTGLLSALAGSPFASGGNGPTGIAVVQKK